MQTSPEICELSDAIRTVESQQEIIDGLVEALEPFAKFACDEPCECFNCKARAALAKAKE